MDPAEWKVTENKQRARYYRLTAAGQEGLAAEESRWNRLVEAIARVMKPGVKEACDEVLATIP